jgi:hypothetical protein
MRTAAIIIGIDEYVSRPLTSAVNDATAFRQALLDLGLVEEQHITMLTSPVGDSDAEATRDNIADLLWEFYDHGESYDRLFFFYSGHGLLAFSDAARGRVRNTLMPSDVQDLRRHGAKLLDLDEIRERFELSGPVEQLFFIDACRDLNYDAYPDVGNLGWGGGQQLGPVRRQATLFAVSPLGQAEAAVSGYGRMTAQLLHGLRSDRVAVDYDEINGEWVVTMRSLSDYVQWAIKQELSGGPVYRLKYMVPQLDESDPKPSPVRVVHPVEPAPLTVHIIPDELASQTQVDVSLRGHRLDNHCLPPRQNHEELPLQPQLYRVEAYSTAGDPDPPRKVIDLRKQQALTIRVVTARAPARVPESGPAAPAVEVTTPAIPLTGVGDLGTVLAEAQDPHVTVELDGLERPYQHWSAQQVLDQEVPAGPYRVRFRVGPDAFSEEEIYVNTDESVLVKPTVAVSPLVQEALGFESEIPTTVLVSESIGPIQAELLPTMLTIIGIKPFDVNQELFYQFEELIAPRDPATYGMRPLSLVVAVDGNRWPVSPLEVLASVRCTISAAEPVGLSSQTLTFQPLARPALNRWVGLTAGEGYGLARTGLAVTGAPANSFTLHWESPFFGSFRLAGAAIQNRATVVTLTLRPDGALDVSQNLLRLPGRDDLYADELVPNISYGRMVRELQLGQQLYRSGELISVNQQLSEQGDDTATLLLYAKWTDPILGCMAYFTRLRAADEGLLGDAQSSESLENDELMRQTAHNLNAFFGELPDSRVIYGLAHPDDQSDIYADLIARNQIPVLAEGARRLAAFAEAHGQSGTSIAQITRRVPIDQIWTFTAARERIT